MTGANHLSDDELIETVEGRGHDAARAHAAACEQCGAGVAQLRAVLGRVQADEMPEPSPVFWDHFSSRVRSAVERESAPARRQRWRDRWAWRFVSLAAAAGVLVVAVVVMNRPDTSPVAPVSPEPAGAGLAAAADTPVPGADDGTFDLVTVISTDLAGEDGAAASFDERPGSAERAVEHLSLEEQSELVRLLEAAMARRPS